MEDFSLVSEVYLNCVQPNSKHEYCHNHEDFDKNIKKASLDSYDSYETFHSSTKPSKRKIIP